VLYALLFDEKSAKLRAYKRLKMCYRDGFLPCLALPCLALPCLAFAVLGLFNARNRTNAHGCGAEKNYTPEQ
jgi:hypothetical protein